MALRILFVFFLILIFELKLFAQSGLPYESDFLSRVKQLDDFFERFNHTGSPDANVNGLSTRQQSVLSLFNNTARLDPKLAKTFVLEVANSEKPVFVGFYDKEWYAQVICNILYEGQQHQLVLTLQNQGDMIQGSKWIIKGAKADFLQVKKANSDVAKILHPMSHEEDFIALHRVFNDKQHILAYSSLDYMPDQLNVLFFLIQNGKITFEHTLKITYHFLQIPGWVFTVNFENRIGHNAGWLINKLQPINEQGAKDYKVNELSIHKSK